MTSPFQLIAEFNELDRHDFKLFVKNSTSKRNSIINEFLGLVYQGFTSKVICEKLYGSYPHTAFYALRKRLTHLLLEYFANERDKELDSPENEVMLLFKAGKKLILNKKYKIGFEYVGKALKKSKDNEFLELTLEILMELVQVAHLNPKIKLSSILLEVECYKNLKNKNDTIAIVYAQVKEKLNEFFLNSIEVSALKEIECIFQKHTLSIDQDLSYRTLYQLGQLSLATSTVTKNFVQELTGFGKIAENIIASKIPKNSNQWTFKLKLLYLLASSNYRAKRFEKSKDYLNRILKLSKTNKVTLLYEFHFKIVVLKSLNINYLGDNRKAFEVLDELLKTSKLQKSNKNWLDGYGVMSMILFHGKQYSSIVKLYRDFKRSDIYFMEIIGLEWVLRKNLVLILTHFELGNIEISEELITRFNSDNQRFLSENPRVTFFMTCIQKVVSNPFQAQNSHFHRFVESKLEKKPRYEEDIFVLSFFAWLKAKMLGEEVYESTIELVGNLGNEI